jgi:pimeloyl-ACP methyl ester carboxylesterase
LELPSNTGLVLPADDGGSGGLPVVFLHALAGSSAHWALQVTHLRAQRRAIALTLRGHAGAPSPTDDDYTIASLAADVARTVDLLGLERFALVGHSVGAHVALTCAAALPQRVAGVLLADPTADTRQAPRAAANALLDALASEGCGGPAALQHYRALLVGARPQVALRVLADLRATPPAAVLGVMRSLLDYDPLAALAAYPGPALAVVTWLGEQPFSLHRVCPALRSARLGDTGHWLQLDRPNEFNLILDGWLSALNPVRREVMAAAAARRNAAASATKTASSAPGS